MSASIVYITVGDVGEARRIATALIEERLAACANILDGARSIFRWEGEIQEDRETILIVKTKTALVPELSERVRELHSYDCACVVSWPLQDGNAAFLDWIASETRIPGD